MLAPSVEAICTSPKNEEFLPIAIEEFSSSNHKDAPPLLKATFSSMRINTLLPLMNILSPSISPPFNILTELLLPMTSIVVPVQGFYVNLVSSADNFLFDEIAMSQEG